MNIDPKDLAEQLARQLGPAIEAATRMADAQGVVQTILQRTFGQEVLDAIELVMRGPAAIAELPQESRLPVIHHACDVLENYRASMGRLQ